VLARVAVPAGWAGALLLLLALGYLAVYRELARPAQLALVAAIALLAVFFLGQGAAVGQAMRTRGVRYGSNTVLVALVFLALMGMVNFLAGRYSQRFDLTASQQFSLSQQTIAVLQRLPAEVVVTGFFLVEDEARRQATEDLLKEYAARTDRLRYSFVDPDLQPAVAQSYGIRQSGTIVFQLGDKRQLVLTPSESAFTSALLKLTSPERVVYWLTGHGERDINQAQDPGGYGLARLLLERENYRVELLALATRPAVPDDAAAVLIVGPRSPLLPEEQQALQTYLQNGGKLYLAIDPASQARDSVNALIRPWGLEVGPGFVVDADASFFSDPRTPVIQRYADMPITRDLAGVLTVFPLAAPIDYAGGAPDDLNRLQLLLTSSRAWSETNPEALENPDRAGFDEGQDKRGPLALAMVSERRPKADDPATQPATARPRLFVIGDSDYATNQFIQTPFGNQDLFVNAVNWVTAAEELITIRPKLADNRPLAVTPAQFNLVVLTSLGLLPLAVLALGGLVWWSRR
jgi:ABC-type uncharacterized transport system involved in gliding motility auxiliary subunit